jgi:selenocysteine lyase/cysteine desulfurase
LALGAFAALWHEDSGERIASAAQRAGDAPPEQLAADEDFWVQIQQAFTVDRSLINLNNGGVSPAPRVAQDALKRYLDVQNQAPSRTMWQTLDPQVETVREKLAMLFGAGPDEIAITRNASESLETLIYGIDLKAGDEVLTTEHDYPRMLTTYRQRETREGIKLVTVPVPAPVEDPAELVALFEHAITPRTRVLLVSHVVFLTGQIFPVRDICRLGKRHGLPVIVDGAHAFAHLAFQRADLECDYYGTSLHKWLTAPIGTGMLFVARDKIPAVWPLMAAAEPRSDSIRKFEEIGTHSAAERLAIAEAIGLYLAIGPQRKEARLRFLRDAWAKRLMQDPRVKLFTRLDPQHSCGIATLAIEGVEPQKLYAHLWSKHRIFVVAIESGDVRGIRVTPNTYTTMPEIDLFCRAIEDVLANGIPA